MYNDMRDLKVGVYVDVSNIAQNGGYGMHYDVLRQFACRTGGVAMRLNAYVAYDESEAKHNPEYREKALNFHAILRDYGYKVIVKTVKYYHDIINGSVYGKANADLDMAVDALLQSERLDYVLLVTGDGDFVQVVRALQNKGCRVEVTSFDNVSNDLKNEADIFTSGYLIPNLLPSNYHSDKNEISMNKWGEINQRVRGICYSFNHEKGYGFMRYMKSISQGLWIIDTRKNESPYHTCFIHHSQIPQEIDISTLPNREYIFEFQLIESDKGLQAVDIELIYQY